MRPPFKTRTGLAALTALAMLAGPISASPVFAFGKNKVIYDRFDWQVYESIHFEIYYYPEEEEFLDQMISFAESAYKHVSTVLEHEVVGTGSKQNKIPLIFYKTHGEFEQTNVSLIDIPEAVGAFAEPFQNRIVLPIDSPPDEVYEVLVHELVHIFEYSILYGDSLRRTLRSSPPLWIMEGLSSYIAQDEDNIDRMVIRDAVVNNILPPIQNLNQLSFLTYRFGHAIFDFIDEEWGEAGIRNFMWEYRRVLLTNNVPRAIKESFGIEVDEFNRRFNKYLRRKYFPILMEMEEPADYGQEIGLKRPGRFTFSPTLSPSGELVAALATPGEELDVIVLSSNDGKVIRNLTKGYTNRYDYVTTEAFDGRRDLSWSPEGDRLAFFVRKGNGRDLLIYDALKGKRKKTIPVDVDIPASPAFAPDGESLLFAGNRAGIFDIYRLWLDDSRIENVTDDNYFDSNPSWDEEGRYVLYNRRIGEYEKIFLLDIEDPDQKTQLTFGESSELMPVFGRDGETVWFVSDRGEEGIFNLWSLDTENGDLVRWTDLVGGAFAPVQLAADEERTEIAYVGYFRGTFRLFRMNAKDPLETIPGEMAPEAVDVEPFKPPLNLTADASANHPYNKLRWNIDVPSITIGAADDGTIFSNTDIAFTDLLGDHRIRVRLASVSSFSNMDVSYINLKRRFQWGARGFDQRDFYVAGTTTSGTRLRQEQRFTGAEALAFYPFNRYYRVEAAAGYQQRRTEFPVFDPFSDTTRFLEFKDDYVNARLAIAGDTTRFKFFGPHHGNRFRLEVGQYASVSGDRGDYTNYLLDYRAYGKLTSRSLVAFRLASIVSTGDGADILSFGGFNQLRGFDFREFVGNRVAFSNVELRFPLIDDLRFPFGSIGQLRGTIFLDAGAAWFEDSLYFDGELGRIRSQPDDIKNLNTRFRPIKFDVWDSENDRLQDLRATWGVGFHMLFGGLELHWDFARLFPYTAYEEKGPEDPVTGLRELRKVKVRDSSPKTNFWIGFQF